MPDYLETGFFAKVGAWHGKGIVTAARLTADEAYKQSGQDYTVIPSPIWVNGKEVKTHVATVPAIPNMPRHSVVMSRPRSERSETNGRDLGVRTSVRNIEYYIEALARSAHGTQ
jgi:hypothetical protein